MSYTVLVPGMTREQHDALAQLERDRDVRFYPLLAPERLVASTHIELAPLLEEAREKIAAFEHPIDGIIPHWDFPTSVLAPIMANELGLRSPTLGSVLRCEHKYWSRVEQRASIPAYVPRFELVDPLDENAASEVGLEYPFWLKPVKSHSSMLGFRIDDKEQLEAALAAMRASLGNMAEAFDEALELVGIPDGITDAAAFRCVAEELLTGQEFAIEGSVAGDVMRVHGVFDMQVERGSHSIDSFLYPAARVPAQVQEEAIGAARDFLADVGFLDGCFNAEFFWNHERQLLRLIEVNTRISQSHTEMFMKVDGAPNHLVALDVALGRAPSMPHRRGAFPFAALFYVTTEEDGVVEGVPGPADLEALERTCPGAKLHLAVRPGDRLSRMANQDEYRFRLGTLVIGLDDPDELDDRFRACRDCLPFAIKRSSEEENHGVRD